MSAPDFFLGRSGASGARHGRPSQRGMAIIAALVVVAAASVAAASLIERQTVLVDALTVERDRADARWILRGGLDWARVVLIDDARRNAVTRNSAVWAQPIVGLEIATPDGTRKALFSGQIEDEQGKYNIRRLADRGIVMPREMAVLQRLLATLGLPTAMARTVAERVAASQAATGRDPAAPGLRTLNDLVGLEGISTDLLIMLSAYLTVLPEKTALNVNSAPAEVLSAGIPGLDLARARELVGQRDAGQWFNSGDDFFRRLARQPEKANQPVSVRSDWFRVTGQVGVRDSLTTMQALLHRQGDGAPMIKWLGGLD